MNAPSTGELADLPLSEVLQRLAAPTPAPGGGAAAALGSGLAAGLVEMASGIEGSAQAAGRGRRAAELRARALALAERDLTSYEPVLQALRRPAEDPERPARLAGALSAAADVPLGIVQLSAELAGLAREATDAAGRHLLGDCAAAALLAEAACRAAALLVEINLRDTDDPRLAEVGQAVEKAAVARQRVVARARDS